MSVFELRGPEFLVFYAVLSAAVLALTAALRRFVDGSGVAQSPSSLVSDPYLVAQLRGGAPETLRVALLSLVDRDLIEESGGTFRTRDGVQAAHGHRPIERELLTHYRNGGDGPSVLSLVKHCEPFEERLRSLQLIPDASIRARRLLVFVPMLLILGGVAAKKVSIGLSRGRPVTFLLILGVISVGLLYKVAMPRRTRAGENLLADIRRLFGGLKERAATIRRGGSTSELALLAAVFGLTAVPLTVFPQRALLYPQASSSSSGCGSSSSCGSSCGGGCGGGCGGCGS
jgi:uncharacterized protein (TIGR04222 family)